MPLKIAEPMRAAPGTGKIRPAPKPRRKGYPAGGGGKSFFHDDHGYGHVVEVRDSDDPEEGPVVRVRFESGRETRFLSEYQGSAFEKIGGDE